MTHVSKTRLSFKTGVAIPLALLLLWLSKQAFESAYFIGGPPPESVNLFAASKSGYVAQNTLSQTLDQLNVNVWGRERAELVGRLDLLLQSQINQTPFDAQLWRNLVVVQSESGTGIEERAWTLAQAWKFNNWNKSERFNLTHHCVDEYEQFGMVAPELCSLMIRAIPVTSNERVLAHFLGVSDLSLSQILAAEGLSYEKLNRE